MTRLRPGGPGGYATLAAVLPQGARRQGRHARSASWNEAMLLAAILLSFAVLAKASHAARPVLGLTMALLVCGLAVRSFHLGVSLYVLTFPVLTLMPGRLLGLPAANPTNLMLLGLLVLLLVRGARPEGKPPPAEGRGLMVALMAFYAWTLVEVFIGWGTGVPLGVGFDMWRKFLVATLPFLFGAAVARQGPRPRAFLVGSVLTSTILITAWGAIGFGAKVSAGADGSRLRASGRLGQPNNYGAFLALLLPAFVTLALTGKGWKYRAVGVAGVGLCLMNLVNAASRAGVLAAGVGLLVLTLVRHRVLLVVGVVLALALGSSLLPEKVEKRFTGTFTGDSSYGGKDKSTALRLKMYSFAPEVWAMNPIAGGGLASFPVLTFRTGKTYLARSTHSFYLKVLTEMGLIGVIVFGWFTLAMFPPLIRRIRSARGVMERGLVVSALASCFVYLVICAFQDPYADNEQLLPFFFLGLGMALATFVPGSQPPAEAPSRLTAFRRHGGVD